MNRNSFANNIGAGVPIHPSTSTLQIAPVKPPEDAIQLSSLSQAAEHLAFPLKVPRGGAAGALEGVYVSNMLERKERVAYMHFKGGRVRVQITAQYWPEQPDYSEAAKKMAHDKSSGTILSDTSPRLVYINGREAQAIRPGYNVFNDRKEPRPGFVDWFESSARYIAYGSSGGHGTHLWDLLAVARSMK